MGLGAPAPKPRQDVSYQGLPARVEIPPGERHSYFGQELLSTDSEHAVTVLLISSSLVWLFGALLVALALAAVWRSRQALAAGVRERFSPAGGASVL